jgi:Flp pilus assembly protein TadD/TolB-like protein
MATGKHPFLADSSAEVISSILSHHPPEVNEVREGLPEFLSGVINRCLVKDPDDRYQSARELEDDLVRLRDSLLSGSGPQTLVVSDVARTSRTGFHVPRWAAAALLIATALVVGALVVGRLSSKPLAPLRTLAVVPFANLTGDPELDSLAEGMSAGLLNRLREQEGLQLMARSEAWNLRDRSPGDLAEEFGIGSVVGGEILMEGSRLESTVSLTDTATGLVLWSHTYTAPGGEIFGLQRVMASDLATFLSIPLSEDDRRRFARGSLGADQAFDFYVTGRRFLDSVDEFRGPDAAAENFRQALRLNPDFALAHAGLSEALWEIYLRDLDTVALEGAEDHAEKAREIAPEMPEARLALARVYRSTGRHDDAVKEVEAVLAAHPRADEVQRELSRNYERAGDLVSAEQALRAATSLRPGDWINWNVLGNFLADAGKYEEARDAYVQSAEVAPPDVVMPREKLATYHLQVGEIDTAIDIYESLPKPIRSPRLASNLATAYFFSDRPEKWQRAEENYLLAVRLSPQDPMYQTNLGDLYQRLERTEEALERYRLACELLEGWVAEDPDNPESLSNLAFYSAKSHDCSRAMTLVPQLEEMLPETGPNAHMLAYINALCGEEDAAIGALTRAIALGESTALIRQEDEFRSLRDRPDFQALLGG